MHFIGFLSYARRRNNIFLVKLDTVQRLLYTKLINLYDLFNVKRTLVLLWFTAKQLGHKKKQQLKTKTKIQQNKLSKLAAKHSKQNELTLRETKLTAENKLCKLMVPVL